MQERAWLLHYGLFLFSRHPEGPELFLRMFITKEYELLTFSYYNRYLSVMEIYCPWLLRYVVVIAMNQERVGRTVLTHVAEMIERNEMTVTDPILLFIYHSIIRIDFVTASKALCQCEDVFASDFFLNGCGVAYEEVMIV